VIEEDCQKKPSRRYRTEEKSECRTVRQKLVVVILFKCGKRPALYTACTSRCCTVPRYVGGSATAHDVSGFEQLVWNNCSLRAPREGDQPPHDVQIIHATETSMPFRAAKSRAFTDDGKLNRCTELPCCFTLFCRMCQT
jgi:hypothetical protein